MLKVSYSELTEFAQCRRRWELRYREGWLPPEDPEPLVLGRAVHAGLAAKAKGEDPEIAAVEAITDAVISPERRRWIAAKALPLIEATPIPEGEILGVERRFSLRWDIEGVWMNFVGVFDLVLKRDDHILILDWKTVSRVPNCDRMRELDDQLAVYQAAAMDLWPGEKFQTAWVALSTSLRPRKGESPVQFRRRWGEELKRHKEKYIAQFPVVLTKDRVRRALERVAVLVREIEEGRIYRNPGACLAWPCPYELICDDSSRAEALGFRKLERRQDGCSS